MSFTPPQSFLAKSAARQAKLKERTKQSAASPPSSTLSQIISIQEARKSRRERNTSLKNEYEGIHPEERNYRIFGQLLTDERKKYSFDDGEKRPRSAQGITVCVRKRRLNSKEIQNQNLDITTIDTNDNVYIHEPRIRLDMERAIETHKFAFDYAFDEDIDNATIYNNVVKDLVNTMYLGGKVLLFAYGQTGSGKTYTIFGDKSNPGIYLSACRDMVKKLPKKHTLHVRFFEIYSAKVFDLLNSRKRVQLLEDAKGNTIVQGLVEKQVENFQDFQKLVEIGRTERTTGSTEANSSSSRSHAVFQIIMQDESFAPCGQFTFVDLAGSERGHETGNISRQARIEGSEINKSLLALKECIRSLYRMNSGGNEDVHVPFRGSKLTQILKESFTGRMSKTVMVATIGPGSLNAEHTLNTLRYADRVKELKSKRSVKISGRERESNEELSDENDNDASVSDVGDGESISSEDVLQFKADHDEEQGQQPKEEEDAAAIEKDDAWLRSQSIIEKHSSSVDKMLKILRQEEQLLRDLLNDEISLEEYSGNLESFLGQRIEETMSVYNMLKEDENEPR